MIQAQRRYDSQWDLAPLGPSVPIRRPYAETAAKSRLDLLQDYVRRENIRKSERDDTIGDSGPEGDAATLPDGEAPTKAEAEVLSFPTYKALEYAPSEMMWALQEWDGFVASIEEDHFVGILSPVGGGFDETERLEYPLAVMRERDRRNLVPGSIFRFTAGYSKKRTGTIRQQTALYFRPRSAVESRANQELARGLKDLFKCARKLPSFGED